MLSSLFKKNTSLKYIILSILLLFIDQLVKFSFCSNFFFENNCLINTGSAFSMFSNILYYSIFVGYLGLTIAVIIMYYHKSIISFLSLPIVSLLSAGIISNSLDRVFIGGVRDMITIPNFSIFGVFNIADIYLSAVCIYAIYILLFHK